MIDEDHEKRILLPLICRNISGVYTMDFPDLPPVMYNFTGDDLSTSLAEAAQGTSVKVLNYNETVEMVF